MWQSWVNGVLGLWTIMASFAVTGSSYATRVNSIIVGIIVAVLGFSAARATKWKGTVNGILGIWLVIAGIAFSANQRFSFWNYLITGILITAIAFSSVGRPERMVERHA